MSKHYTSINIPDHRFNIPPGYNDPANDNESEDGFEPEGLYGNDEDYERWIDFQRD